MKDTHHLHDHHEHNHSNDIEKTQEVVETFKEEGMLTVETLDLASHEATTEHRSRRRQHFVLTTPVAVIVGACIISFAIIAYGFMVRDTSGSPTTTLFAGRSIDGSDYVEGKVKSDVVVIEYSDPECPFCVQLHPTVKQLRNEYKDKVAFVYRYFPLTQIHPHAFDETRAIACAGTVGGTVKFYEYIDALFGYKITNRTTQLPATGKEDMARNIGLDAKAFATCMGDQKIADTVNASIADGAKAGVQGTPSTFILRKTRKGYEIVSMVDGARPYSYLKAAVDQAISK